MDEQNRDDFVSRYSHIYHDSKTDVSEKRRKFAELIAVTTCVKQLTLSILNSRGIKGVGVDEVQNEVCTRILRSSKPLPVPPAVKRYLFLVSRSVVIDAAQQQLPGLPADPEKHDTPLNCLPEREQNNPDLLLYKNKKGEIRQIGGEKLQQCRSKLTKTEDLCVFLRSFDTPWSEVAKTLNLTYGAARYCHARAIAILESLIEKEAQD